MPVAWPVIDGRVRVLKEEGGPVDEHFTYVRDRLWRREKTGAFYLFWKRFTPVARFYFLTGTEEELVRKEAQLRREDEDDAWMQLIFLEPAVYIMQHDWRESLFDGRTSRVSTIVRPGS